MLSKTAFFLERILHFRIILDFCSHIFIAFSWYRISNPFFQIRIPSSPRLCKIVCPTSWYHDVFPSHHVLDHNEIQTPAAYCRTQLHKNKTNHSISSNSQPSATANKAIHCLKCFIRTEPFFHFCMSRITRFPHLRFIYNENRHCPCIVNASMQVISAYIGSSSFFWNTHTLSSNIPSPRRLFLVLTTEVTPYTSTINISPPAPFPKRYFLTPSLIISIFPSLVTHWHFSFMIQFFLSVVTPLPPVFFFLLLFGLSYPLPLFLSLASVPPSLGLPVSTFGADHSRTLVLTAFEKMNTLHICLLLASATACRFLFTVPLVLIGSPHYCHFFQWTKLSLVLVY